MSIDNARNFVARMREDHDFRQQTLATTGAEELAEFLQSEDLVFDLRQLVGAMAECMAQQESP